MHRYIRLCLRALHLLHCYARKQRTFRRCLHIYRHSILKMCFEHFVRVHIEWALSKRKEERTPNKQQEEDEMKEKYLIDAATSPIVVDYATPHDVGQMPSRSPVVSSPHIHSIIDLTSPSSNSPVNDDITTSPRVTPLSDVLASSYCSAANQGTYLRQQSSASSGIDASPPAYYDHHEFEFESRLSDDNMLSLAAMTAAGESLRMIDDDEHSGLKQQSESWSIISPEPRPLPPQRYISPCVAHNSLRSLRLNPFAIVLDRVMSICQCRVAFHCWKLKVL